MAVKSRKSATLPIRLAPGFTETLTAAARSERRSLDNLVVVAALEYSRTRNLPETPPRREKRKS